jgi:ferredoxin
MPKVFQEKCEACGACINVCAEKALQLVDDVIHFDSARCVKCGACVEVCPTGALMSAQSSTS